MNQQFECKVSRLAHSIHAVATRRRWIVDVADVWLAENNVGGLTTHSDD